MQLKRLVVDASCLSKEMRWYIQLYREHETEEDAGFPLLVQRQCFPTPVVH